ncbi:unnamed protein product [Durusdinium trenchii]|uniref:Selenoprotein O n=1 Tax=Durusdinium trenchii TaxID=1381693 RepID=A0ABP0M7Q9_9DINO
MFHPWPWRLLWLAVVVTHAQFTACVPGRYGRQCEHLCTCADYEECEDGPTGSGECSCMAGEEARCGLPSPPEGATAGVGLGTVDALVFQNLTLQALPLDPETARRSRQVFNASVSLTRPQPFRGSARLALLNPEVARRLGLAPELVDEAIFAELLSGKLPLPSTVQPFAHAYGGHQFGSWSGQLGDGRAMSLGHVLGFAPDQHIAEDSVRWWPWELSLKGAGKTPYSRGGDGRAALANAAREFFAPIFLESNGIPSCGTLAVLGSDAEEDRLARDEWYTGEMSLKKPGITLRAMPSFLRFGSAQLAAKRQGVPGLVRLARYALAVLARMESHDEASSYLERLRPLPDALRQQCFFGRAVSPSCAERASEATGQEVLRCLLERMVHRTSALVAAWMAVGFAHGVMNTDNLSLLGVTVDLNVYGFLSKYDPGWAPNHIDDTARYAFGAQPEIAKWNLERLSDALTGTPFLVDREPDATSWAEPGEWLDLKRAQRELQHFDELFERCYVVRMELRLGLLASGRPCGTDRGPGCVVKKWTTWLEQTGADYPRASRLLAELLAPSAARPPAESLRESFAEAVGANSTAGLEEFLQELQALRPDPDALRAAVPRLSLRSHVLMEAAKLVELKKQVAWVLYGSLFVSTGACGLLDCLLVRIQSPRLLASASAAIAASLWGD